MKVFNTKNGPVPYLVLHLNDNDAEVLIAKLQQMLTHRKNLASLEPALAQWSDTVWVTRGPVDGEPRVISFSIAPD